MCRPGDIIRRKEWILRIHICIFTSHWVIGFWYIDGPNWGTCTFAVKSTSLSIFVICISKYEILRMRLIVMDRVIDFDLVILLASNLPFTFAIFRFCWLGKLHSSFVRSFSINDRVELTICCSRCMFAFQFWFDISITLFDWDLDSAGWFTVSKVWRLTL